MNRQCHNQWQKQCMDEFKSFGSLMLERKIRGSNPACNGIFPGRVISVT